ncbi:PREDICTED: uncharacterized protein LOC107192979 [Dufourea novaeangliae]|uniref:uncharacterized protein LOC107192979 n=1 Tax=Dufourea novaeangliae TaxID=178035 RepID=UPI000767CE74|nr:PREDICTED: uncharacterized protein LOC107192979 [Dufourea novaeangliae]
MSALQQMLTRQKCAMRSIERSLTNFKKLGKEKMTAAVTTNRRSQLEKAFDECKTINVELHVLADDKEKATIPYFAEDHFDDCETIFHETMDFMADWLAGLTKSSPMLNNGETTTPSRTSSHLPSLQLPTFDGALEQWENLNLADDQPMSSDPIDLLIGADLYGQLLTGEIRRRAVNEPVAQSTRLGWILSGPIHQSKIPSRVEVHHNAVFERLDESIRKFWEVETIPVQSVLSPAEEKCERHFRTTHSRAENGESRSAAENCLLHLENRFRRDPELASEYNIFMQDYELLGHMRRVEANATTGGSYYIPHHAVFRTASKTSCLRVVFNASRKTTNGQSLNHLLMSGPKLQQDLTSIFMRWRQYKYVYTADIAKMYRQILISEADVDYQRILWRNTPADPISEYQLLTVTYGTTSAPFQAIRVLQQLAHDDGKLFPLAIPIIKNQTYVDDCLFGADDPNQLRESRDQLVDLLKKGGFHLRKWASNDPALLSDIDPSDHGLASGQAIPTDENLSILGISWNPITDTFQIKANAISDPPRTKRAILSEIAKLFDPLGWIVPVIVTAKILMQQLWQSRCDWDDNAPAAILNHWITYWDQLPRVSELSIPRLVVSGLTHRRELHGFSDASAKAYSAVVYQRSIAYDGQIQIAILAAKTRVAPLKTISIPRLELSAALLLAELVKYIRHSTPRYEYDVFCWTDSSITLWWLSKSPNQLKTFVANRVAKIQDTLPDVTWCHVSTDQNPADCASRGLLPAELENHRLWWTGPQWLRETKHTWPTTTPVVPPDICREERTNLQICVVTTAKPWELANRHSSWPKLLRVTAYVMRFVAAVRKIKRVHSTHRDSSEISPLVLHPEEIAQAKLFWLRTMQAETFPSEVSQLKKKPTTAKT